MNNHNSWPSDEENFTSKETRAVAEAEAATAQAESESVLVRTGHFLAGIGTIAVSGKATALLAEGLRAARF